VLFDRDAEDKTIKGILWNSDSHELDSDDIWGLKYSDLSSFSSLRSALTNEYVYKSSDDDKVLIIRADNAALKKKFDSVRTMVLKIDATYADDDGNELEFACNDDDPSEVEIEAIQGINKRTIELFFNQAIDKDSLAAVVDEFVAEEEDGSGDITFSTVIKVSDTQYKLISASGEPDFKDEEYTFMWSKDDDETIKDVTKTVIFKDDDEDKPVDEMSFAGSADSLDDITDISVLMTSKRTIDVFFPVDMLEDVNDANSGGRCVKQTGRYELKDEDNASIRRRYKS
jgi:hypothetical protein